MIIQGNCINSFYLSCKYFISSVLEIKSSCHEKFLFYFDFLLMCWKAICPCSERGSVVSPKSCNIRTVVMLCEVVFVFSNALLTALLLLSDEILFRGSEYHQNLSSITDF